MFETRKGTHAMLHQNSVFHSLLKHVPWHKFEQAVRNHDADALSRKLAVISDTAEVLTDMIDTKRSLRLEFIIVMLIVFEIVITAYQILSGK